MINHNCASGNHNVYANTPGLFSVFVPSVNSIFTKPWILDSGATDHITYDSTLFTKTNSSPTPIVNLPTGSITPITSIGA
jgi:hypothetical protein